MADCPRLDPRPARPLTTREIAKVLGATIGTVAAILGSDSVRRLLIVVAQSLRGEPLEGDVDAREAVVVAVLMGITRALADWSATGDVLTAIEWWINKPGALETFDGLRGIGGAPRGLA